jgi:cellulose synthase/poly-beta-1,6-N-acetylglucosamine synthase-like glycosyltransferase
MGMNPIAASALVLLGVVAAPYLAFLGLYALVRPRGSPARKELAEPTVSIVLPTYNEERIIRAKLEDLLRLDYPMQKIELVVVDSSTDETRSLIREHFQDVDAPELVLIEENERRGLAPALNEAYEAAKHDMVVKTDCDSKLTADVLREAAANLADDEVDAVTGRNVEVLGGSEVESGYRDVQAHIQQLESHLDSTLIFHGPFCAFEQDALVPIDPVSLADDTELALKIRRQGGRVVYDPEVHYMEASHSRFLKRRRQKDRRAMGLIRLLVQHRDALGKYGMYGKAVLPFNWWFMIVSPWLLAGTFVVGTIGIIAQFGVFGAVLPLGVGLFTYLGQRDLLGPAQPLYSLFDTQVSLLRASVELLRGRGDGTWEVDSELREAFE